MHSADAYTTHDVAAVSRQKRQRLAPSTGGKRARMCDQRVADRIRFLRQVYGCFGPARPVMLARDALVPIATGSARCQVATGPAHAGLRACFHYCLQIHAQ
jgi:hypothetical protein